MMRLLFLGLLLLLPAATVLSDKDEGSGFESDDEDEIKKESSTNVRSDLGKATGADDSSDQMTLIVIVVAVAALTLSVAVIVAIMLVKRHMRLQQATVYSVPTEQNQKEAI